MSLAVMSSREQYRLLTGTVPNIEDMRILCDNPELYDFLKEKKIQFDIIDEEILRKDWAAINTWACEKALLWGSVAGNGRLLNNIELDKALSVPISYYLVGVLKNYLFSKYICEKYRPDEVVVFKNIPSPRFPFSNGNYFLNHFLSHFAAKNYMKIKYIVHCKHEEEKRSMPLKEYIRSLSQRLFNSVKITGEDKRTFMACGEIRHLREVVKKLKTEGKNISFYSDEFRVDQLKFCMKEKIRYIIATSFDNKGKESNFNYKDGFIDLIKRLCSNGWFVYKDDDLGGCVEKAVLDNIDPYMHDITRWTRIYCNVMNSASVRALIIDQDEMPDKAFMAAFFKSRGIPVFCVSHGYGAVKFSLPDPSRCFDISYTFLHSEFEKSLFTARGWDERNIRITGIPRYDRLVRLRDAGNGRKRMQKKMKFLYCGSTMTYYTPSVYSYVGVSQYEFGSTMRRDLEYMIRAIEGYPISLIVKAHYLADEAPLTDFVMKNRGKSDVTIVKAKMDFFELLLNCHAVIMAHWSTAVMEGIIARLPMVVLNYSGIEDGFPFAQHGLCTVSRNPRELKGIIEELYSAFISGKMSRYVPIDDGNKTFYTGLNDGLNTDRAVDCIIKTSEYKK